MEAVFGEIPELQEQTMARARQVCRLAGLLHDVGHCCFSHAAEKVLHKKSGHEQLSAYVITTQELLGEQIDADFFPGCAKIVASLISVPAPQLQILADIVSGQIDADRTDYLLRDSHHCGVDYGKFDYRRLIECLTVWQEDAGRPLEMAIHRDGVHSFESLILARYQMNTQVYYHRLRRIYDLYLERYFQTLDQGRFDTPEKVLALNDFRAMVELMEAANNPEAPGHIWASRIIHRRHHRDVFALDEKDGPTVLRKAGIVLKTIRQEHPETEFLEDFPEKMVSIHKIARPSDEGDGRIDFPLIDRGRRFSLGERSQLLERLPGGFRVGYVFADVSEDRILKGKIANRCREIYQNA
jgi:HD superfamily phosphohydrolase